MTYDNPWYYNNQILESEDVVDYVGMVYLLENTENGRRYVGKKFFHRKKVYHVNKKKKRKQVESDWKSYYGSSEELNSDIDKYGKDNFRREILHLCRTKGECGYLEAKEQFVRDALLTDEYYNTWIQVRVRKNHINGLHLKENGV